MSVPTVFIWQSAEEPLGIRFGFARMRNVLLIGGHSSSPIYEVGALVCRGFATAPFPNRCHPLPQLFLESGGFSEECCCSRERYVRRA